MSADRPAVNVVAGTRSAPERLGISARLEAATLPVLGAIVAASFLVRLFAGWAREVPLFFPDEYLYSEVARSLAESGRPLVRGEGADFPALLQPLLTAPAWLVDDVGLSYRLVQGMSALIMSLAALPAFWLARRVGLGRGLALAIAVLAVALPDLMYGSWALSEPFAYPLALAAVCAGVAALERASTRAQLAFVGLAGAATFARAQFVVLPVCFALAVAVYGVARGRLRDTLREQSLPLLIFGIPLLLGAVVLRGKALGLYSSAFDGFDPLETLRATGNEATILLYAAGWVLVPGALLGLVHALRRPRRGAERAFAALVVPLAPALILEAAVYGDASRIHERYTFYLAPLLAISFCLYASRGWPARVGHGLLALGLATLAFALPMSGFAIGEGKENSPFLRAVAWLLQEIRDPVTGSLVVAVLAALTAAAVAGAAFRPRVATPITLGLALAITLSASAGTTALDLRNAQNVRATLPADLSWVDHAGLGKTTLLWSLGANQGSAMEQLFWNRSVDRVLELPGALPLDAFASETISFGRDGSMRAGGQPVTGPLLATEYAATVRLHGARLVERQGAYSLWAPRGQARMALFFLGRYYDGWLARGGEVTVWPEAGQSSLAGWLSLPVTTPEISPRGTLAFKPDRADEVRFALSPGATTTVRLPVCSSGPWHASFSSTLRGFVGERVASVQTGEPAFVPARAACVNPAT